MKLVVQQVCEFHGIFGISGVAELRQALAETVGNINSLCHQGHADADCSFCSSGRAAECNKQAVDRLGEIVFMTFERFTAEDRFMSGIRSGLAPREAIAAHKTDHAEISSRLAKLVHEWQSDNPKQCIRQLALEVRAWLHDHVETHDILLQRLLGADASPGGAQR